ncbi:MAG: ATPase, T2SS/T4P/T4SS family [Steroidobacteraceae bacterium]
MILQEWVARAHALAASDLLLETDAPVVVRVRGELQSIGPPPPAERLLQAAQDLLGAEGWGQFRSRGSADVSAAIAGVRCRANLFRTVRGLAVAVRLLSPAIKDLRGCNLHPDFHRLIDAASGLVLVCGPTGSGKSTTLAALLEEINLARARHIVTLESPLEYIFSNRRSFIRQREIPTHSPSFEQGIIDALRENPDVLVIGEMRTPEVMRLTLNAAETGHLVLATLHAASCAEALSRVCLSFPAEIQASIRAQLADCLVGVSCQRLEFLSSHNLRVPRCELLLPSSGACGTIRGGSFSHLANVLQSGADEGMWSFERYQRWIEQQTEWSRAAAPAVARTGATAGAFVSQSLPAATSSPAATPSRRPGTPSAAHPSATAGGDEIIEVPAEEMNLQELAELARRLGERKP